MKKLGLHIDAYALKVEREQAEDEGKDFRGLQAEYDALLADVEKQGALTLGPRTHAFMEKSLALPLRKGYPYEEPSDLDGIRSLRPQSPAKPMGRLAEAELEDRMLGAWLGRCSGCLLGKPVEGWKSPSLWGYLKDLDRYPLSDYFRSDVPDEIFKRHNVSKERPFINTVDHMVEDDDTNYTVTGLAILKTRGKDFTPTDVAVFWLNNIPILHTFTAERAAYRNFCRVIGPPASAVYDNPFREWIGAQIRADFFGYAAIGNPELAAEFAWRDACISHTKNGIYGEMWVAAMLACAPYETDVSAVISAGLAQIPARSRLAEAINEVSAWHSAGVGYDDAVRRIHARWDENNGHHWCHTISNAQIVVVGLLWGGYDFERSICRAVQGCFDTDCNGATVGSIIGMMHGAKKLPAKWIGPLHDTLDTGIAGYTRVGISDIARESVRIYRQICG